MDDACFGNKYISIYQRRYLGSKTKLLNFIDDILIKEKVSYSTFADIFAGTGVVADYFSSKSNIILNDILESNYLSYLAFFGKDKIHPPLLLERLFEYNNLNIEKISDNYFSKNFANTYFDLPNSKLIGFIRSDIERLYLKQIINKRERPIFFGGRAYNFDFLSF